ncbi:MAG: hypothetical protein K6B71_00195 [Alphaproteobacteria bacterium]|nr:hypothetical protein [Alphaproteobacteria bacterium]
MKRLLFCCAMFFGLMVYGAGAADITIYYSPSCPHCHHALDFISNYLVYEYPDVRVTRVNVMESENRSEFFKTVKKCEFESGGVPVLVIGEKCFQGYADNMRDDFRKAVAVDLDEKTRATAAENRKALDKDADAFRAAHTETHGTISERSAAQPQKKSKENSNFIYYALLILGVLGIGFVLTRKNDKK